METKQVKEFNIRTKFLAENQVEFRITTNDVDRYGDKMNLDGVILENYFLNPIVLWNHDTTKPIGKAISMQKSETDIMAMVELFDSEYAGTEMEPIIKLIKNEKLTAASIGFIPHSGEQVANGDSTYYQINQWELVEFSVVSIPANPKAVKELEMEIEEVKELELSEKVLSKFADLVDLLQESVEQFKNLIDFAETKELHIEEEQEEDEPLGSAIEVDEKNEIEKLSYKEAIKLIN